MVVHKSQYQTSCGMGQPAACTRECTPVCDQVPIERWGSLTSVTSTSSSDWNDIGLPPLPRQRSLSNAADAANQAPQHQYQQQQYQQQLAYASSMPLPEQYLLQQQHSLQACLSMGSDPLEALVYEAAVRHSGSPRSYVPAEADAMLDGDSQVWDTLSPAAFAAASALACARRPQQTLYSSNSMSSTSSGSSNFSQGVPHSHSSRGERCERSYSYSGCSPVAMDVCGSGSARSLPCMDSILRSAGSPRHADGAQPRLSAQELVMLSKLKTILTEKEQLSTVEKQLRHKLEEEASRAATSTGSPRAAAHAAAVKHAFLQAHQQRSSSWSGCARSPQSAHNLHQSASLGSHAPAHGAHGAANPVRHSSSTAAALLAAAADPAIVAEYVRAHKQQQQQHQACMAAVAAAAASGSSPRGSHAGHKSNSRKQGLSPAAMAKLRQLMALQQKQIQVQQELLAML